MHRDVVTHVAVSSADFFITGSVDGKILIMLSSNMANLDSGFWILVTLAHARVCLMFVGTIIG